MIRFVLLICDMWVVHFVDINYNSLSWHCFRADLNQTAFPLLPPHSRQHNDYNSQCANDWKDVYQNLTVPRRLNPRSVLIIAETATVVVIRMSKFKYYIITNIDLNIVIRILIVKLFIYLIYIIAIINYSLIRNLISYRYIIISEIKKIQNMLKVLLL